MSELVRHELHRFSKILLSYTKFVFAGMVLAALFLFLYAGIKANYISIEILATGITTLVLFVAVLTLSLQTRRLRKEERLASSDIVQETVQIIKTLRVWREVSPDKLKALNKEQAEILLILKAIETSNEKNRDPHALTRIAPTLSPVKIERDISFKVQLSILSTVLPMVYMISFALATLFLKSSRLLDTEIIGVPPEKESNKLKPFKNK